jgi:hypothetical protein
MQVARIIVRDIEPRPHMMRAPGVLVRHSKDFWSGGARLASSNIKLSSLRRTIHAPRCNVLHRAAQNIRLDYHQNKRPVSANGSGVLTEVPVQR